MRKIKLEQVGELLQTIYDTETNLKIDWFWDAGFEFAYGSPIVGFDEHPIEVMEAYRKIDATKIEDVASLILLEYELNHSIVDSNQELNSMGKFINNLKN